MPSKSESHDLSQCEVERLQNIRRNEDFLKTLGIGIIKQEIHDQVQIDKEDSLKERKRKIASLEASSTSKRDKKNVVGFELRRSSRLKGDSAAAAPPVKEIHRGYDDMPLESNDLDDYEFKVFVILKAWRLKTCRGLDIEPFKVFQNRTLCEIVRRRRNNPTWATTAFDPAWSVVCTESESDEKGEKEKETVKIKNDIDTATSNAVKKGYTVADQLMMCWGVGPSKVREDKESPGFAFGAIDVLNNVASAEHKTEATAATTVFKNENENVDAQEEKKKELTISELLQRSRENPNTMTS